MAHTLLIFTREVENSAVLQKEFTSFENKRSLYIWEPRTNQQHNTTTTGVLE